MGIKNLMKLISKYSPESLEIIDLSNIKSVCIDTNLFIYKYITAIRKQGYDLKNKSGKIISHIINILRQIINLKKYNIDFIYVIDGGYPIEKEDVLQSRKNKNIIASQKLKEKLSTISDFQQSFHITDEIITDMIELFDNLGVKYIISPNEIEADAVCAKLTNIHRGMYVYSTDMDMLAYGAKNMVLQIDFKKKKALVINLNNLLKKLDINYNQFLDICILLGTDFCDKIPGIGFNNALKIIKNVKSIDNVINDHQKLKKIKKCKDIFKQQKYKMKLINNRKNMVKLKKKLIEYDFKEDFIDKIIKI